MSSREENQVGGTRALCTYCGKAAVVADVAVSEDSGLYYRTGKTFFVHHLAREPLLAELCRECGTVGRLYVRYPDQDWYRLPTEPEK